MTQSVEDRLISAARGALANSYAPYSRFPVGAALIDDQGRMFTGVNVENVSFGLTVCAERVAIFTAITAGAKSVSAFAVSAKHSDAVTPCGACRQVLIEFAQGHVPVFLDAHSAHPVRTTVGALLPNAFTHENLPPTK